MKKTKKVFMILLAVVLAVVCTLSFAACNDKDNGEIDILMPDGTPALALASVLSTDADFSDRKTNFQFVTADVISTAFSALNADIAVMPTVVAAKLYSQGQKIKMLSANVFGNLYVCGVNTTANSLQDLKGNVVMVTVGTTLNLLKYLLAQNEIPFEDGAEPIQNKVVLNHVADASSIIPQLSQASKGTNQMYGVLGEPQVTKCKQLVSSLSICVDFQTEWKTLTDFEGYPQAGLFATEQFCLNNKNYIKKLLSNLSDNTEYLKNNLSGLPALFEKFESNLAKMTFTLDTITKCNLKLVNASDAKTSVVDYINRLSPATPIDDAFFYAS